MELHAFARRWHKVYEDFVTRQTYEMRMQNALEQFERAYDRMPDSWSIVGDDVPLPFTPEDAYGMLLSCRHEDFWKP
ncbi:HipA family kinase [Paraburkholderia xenovorans]